MRLMAQRLVCESVFVHVSDGGVHCSLTEALLVPVDPSSTWRGSRKGRCLLR